MRRREFVASAVAVGFSGAISGCVNSSEDDGGGEPTEDSQQTAENPHQCETYRYNTEELALRTVRRAYRSVNDIPREVGVTYPFGVGQPISLLSESDDGEETYLYPREYGGVWYMTRGDYFAAISSLRDANQLIEETWELYEDADDLLDNCEPRRVDLLEQAVVVGKERLEGLEEAVTHFDAAAKAFIDAGVHEVHVIDEGRDIEYTDSIGLHSPQFEGSWAPEANSHFNKGVRTVIQSFEAGDEYPSNLRNRIMVYDPDEDG